MTLPKPKFCGQKWLEMRPTSNGRLCGSCEKEIFDFSKLAIDQIEALQKENNNSLCGMYSKKQLKFWEQKSKRSRFSLKSAIAASTLFLASGEYSGSELKAREKEYKLEIIGTNTFEINEKSKLDSIPKAIIKGVITTINKKGESEPLPFANIFLSRHNIGTTTDIEGKYRIEITDEKYEPIKDTLTASYFGYPPNKTIFDPIPVGTNIKNIQFDETVNNITVFYVTVPTKWQRFKWKVKSILKKK